MNIRLVENEALENQGVSKNQIDRVFITKLTLEILSPRDGDDFTFLESLTFKIRGEGLETLDIARGGNFEPGLTQNRSRHRRRGYRSLRRPRFDGYHHRGEWPPTEQ